MQKQIKCSKCSKIVSFEGLTRHLQNNHIVEFSSKNEMELFCVLLRNNITDSFASKIAQESIKHSVLSLSSKYKIPYKDIRKIIICKGRKIHSLNSVAKLIAVRKLYKKTCNSKYGVDNVSKSPDVKRKKEETFRLHYGVDNIFSDPNFIESIDFIMMKKYGKKRLTNGPLISSIRLNFSPEKKKNISNKQRKTLSEFSRDKKKEIIAKRHLTISNLSKERKKEWHKKLSEARKKWWTPEKVKKFTESWDQEKKRKRSEFLKKWWSELPLEKRQMLITNTLNNLYKNGYHSGLELKVKNALDELSYDYKYQFWLDKSLYDFRIGNTILEVQGDYWHANPIKYKSDDIFKFSEKSITAQQIWDKDIMKKQKAEKKGYDVIYLWENEIRKSLDIGKLILDKLNGKR